MYDAIQSFVLIIFPSIWYDMIQPYLTFFFIYSCIIWWNEIRSPNWMTLMCSLFCKFVIQIFPRLCLSCSLWCFLSLFFTVTWPLTLSPQLHETWGVFLLPSGAESPQAIQKLMGLSASVKPHKSHYPLPPAPSGVNSPSVSSGRRPPTSPRHSAALRSHPVHLSPESSSVVSLSNIACRRPQRTGKTPPPLPPHLVSRKGTKKWLWNFVF